MNAHKKALTVLEKLSKELKGKRFLRGLGLKKNPDKAGSYIVIVFLKCPTSKDAIPKKMNGIKIEAKFFGNLKQKKVPVATVQAAGASE